MVANETHGTDRPLRMEAAAMMSPGEPGLLLSYGARSGLIRGKLSSSEERPHRRAVSVSSPHIRNNQETDTRPAGDALDDS